MKRMIITILCIIFLLGGCGEDEATEKSLKLSTHNRTGSGETTAASFQNEYPEKLADTALWTEYPDDNILGLCGTCTDSSNSTTTMILAFRYLKKAEISDKIMNEYDYLTGMCPYGYFKFDDIKVLNAKNYYFVKLGYDSRISLTVISFDKEDERCNISFKDGVSLSYCDFRNLEKSRKVYQSLDPDTNVWNDTNENTINELPKEDTGYTQYTELAVDQSAYDPSNETDGVTFTALDYRYTQEHYNIYGEIEQDAATALRFRLSSEDHTIDEQNSFRLYQSVGNIFTDITPKDITLDTSFEKDDHYMNLTMQSNTLGEMSEGDYRVEYGDYSVDFRLSVQTYEVW